MLACNLSPLPNTFRANNCQMFYHLNNNKSKTSINRRGPNKSSEPQADHFNKNKGFAVNTENPFVYKGKPRNYRRDKRGLLGTFWDFLSRMFCQMFYQVKRGG